MARPESSALGKGSACLQPVVFLLGHPQQPAIDELIVLAEAWGRAVKPAGRVGELRRQAVAPQRAYLRVSERNEVTPLCKLRVGVKVFATLHDACRNAGRLKRSHKLVRVEAFRPVTNQSVHLRFALFPPQEGPELRAPGPQRLAHDTAQGLPLLVGGNRNSAPPFDRRA